MEIELYNKEIEKKIELENEEKKEYLKEFEEKIEKMFDKLPPDITKLIGFCKSENTFEGSINLRCKTDFLTFSDVFKEDFVIFRSSCCDDDFKIRYIPSLDLHLFFCNTCQDLDLIMLRKIAMTYKK